MPPRPRRPTRNGAVMDMAVPAQALAGTVAAGMGAIMVVVQAGVVEAIMVAVPAWAAPLSAASSAGR
ncbi:hypothetical protein GLI01_12730 [Gluconacetobacter liquefaciens]|nr:hypothetical protein GLI01_12730 [Gluconacetobacter liquefaciens]